MIVFRRILASLCAQPLGSTRAATKRLLAFVGVTHDALGLEDELFLVPVVVVDAGAIEALDHLGGAGAGFDGLEDTEGDQGAAVFIVQSVRVDDEGDVGEGLGEVEGVDADLLDIVPPADVEGRDGRLPRGAGVDIREFEGNVADAGAPVGDAQLAGARGDGLAILAAHVRDARANLRLRRPTCALPRRLCLVYFLLHLRRLTHTQLRHLRRVHALTLSFFLVLSNRAGYGTGLRKRKTSARRHRSASSFPTCPAHKVMSAHIQFDLSFNRLNNYVMNQPPFPFDTLSMPVGARPSRWESITNPL